MIACDKAVHLHMPPSPPCRTSSLKFSRPVEMAGPLETRCAPTVLACIGTVAVGWLPWCPSPCG